jgi:hypothetical protein
LTLSPSAQVFGIIRTKVAADYPFVLLQHLFLRRSFQMPHIRRKISLSSVLVLLFFFGSQGFSQTVTLPVQVLKNGSAVQGASKEAITLADNGKAVSISQFTEVHPPAGEENGLTIVALDTMHSPPRRRRSSVSRYSDSWNRLQLITGQCC